MKKAIVITAYDRLRYFQAVLSSWYEVRGLENWHVLFSIDPSTLSRHMIEECEEFAFHRGLTDYEIVVNEEKLGVLEHPYQALDLLFRDYEFVIRAEDDLIVSDDILEFFEWAAFKFERDPAIATVNAWSDDEGPSNLVEVFDKFSPLVWGTWSDRWVAWIRPTWDRDYSTNNGTPMTESGWDWNIQREFGSRVLSTVRPRASRVQNIGEYGTHATPDDFIISPSFKRHHSAQKWECR
jgi:hypothetical protein